MKLCKKYKDAFEKVDRDKMYLLKEALNLVKDMPKAKFDESVDVSVKLNLNKNQRIRGMLTFLHSFGKPKRVIVIAKGEKAEEARNAGADAVGDSDIIDKIKKGWFDFDSVVATPDMMKDVSKLGPILGRKGLMPNPKAGTVTFEIKQAVKAIKEGKTEFKSDKTSVISLSFGKISMENDKLMENVQEFYNCLLKSRPQDSKGEYVTSFTISKTMGPGVKVNFKEIIEPQSP